jgi:hypothetical protein
MAAKKNTASDEITDILKVTTGTFECCIVGTSPLILNRMSEKAKHELLLPKGRKNAVERATSLKHIPIDEYRASAYTLKDDSAPTLLAILSTAFKGALRSAALDMPGAKKAQIGRLTYIAGEMVGIYGQPRLFMSITRSADMNKTPDVRTRAIVPAWACKLQVTFVQPLIRAQAVANLLAAAGITIGVGDWRPEKGAGSYGQFRIADKDDKEFLSILKSGGRKAQVDGMENPVAYDDETTELLSWFEDELSRRTLKGVA